MIKKTILLVIVVVFGTSLFYGQNITKAQTIKAIEVQGTVIAEEDNQPVLGVTVLVKGTTKGVATDFDGKFTIALNVGDILIFSSLGFETKELEITEKKALKVYLKSSIEALELITVVGYGVQEKRDLTGAIGTIKAKDLDKTIPSFDNALAGKIAGVQVISSSGAPGSATAITIRGITSLNANSNNPLIVIDGVPVYGTNRSNNTVGFERSSILASGFGGTFVASTLENKSEFERNPLAMLNMNDIESIEVLKDAYATAIYGSRGAAGVILITTKNGTSKKPRISLNYTTTFNDPIDTPSLLSASQYSNFYNLYTEGNNYPLEAETNWLDSVLQTGITSNVNISVSAGDDKLKYFVSASYLNQEAYIVNQDYKKYSFRGNADYKLTNTLKLGLNGTISYTDNAALNAQSIYRNAVLKGPNLAAKNDDGSYKFGFSPNLNGLRDNPLAQAYKDRNYVKDDRVIGNVYLEYKPFRWLTLKSEMGIDVLNSKSYSRLISRPVDLEGGSATQTKRNNKKFVVNNTASIVKVFNNIHSINSVIGQSFETSREESASIFGGDFASDHILDIYQAGRVGGNPEPIIREWALFSVFGRLNYQYDHKYLAGVTYRVDGSSRFSKNNRYVGFPSFSLGWRASEEAFLENVNWLDQLKFRGSIGFSGIDGTSGYYGDQGQYELLRAGDRRLLYYLDSEILQVVQPNNPNLKWERTKTIDLGLDLDLFGEKVSLTVDYYYKKISNLLYASAVPWYQGYAIQQQNIGDMENRGFEVNLSTENIANTNFSWVTNFNISRNTNKILKLNFEGSDTGGAALGYKYFAEGQPAGQFFLYDWAGVNPLTGNPLWNYPDGTQSEVHPASRFSPIRNNPHVARKPMGDALPDFFGGLTNTFRYKNWKLEAFFSFSYGSQLYNGTKALQYTYSTQEANNLSPDILDYWKIAGHRTDIPSINNASIEDTGFGSRVDYISGRDSDRFLEDGSYIRLKNISLTYNVPKSFLENNFLKSASIFIQGNNLLTFTKYSGLDPEVSAFGSSALLSGYDELTLPQSKSYSIGVNIGF
ncbi:SusC/RagA family TonB-linked outer membrane protein [Snuella sedimenti]|uniref:TonB-dependent receptor n=1 Tax=Snuella sedimenti TaxID=2798802 RepID=A0A8J7IST7_9FLAO|nr:TonB-dependent receptor [Snuella sedimenti]MBJ6367280.1 TonB-dependent receptor [Snuella sedimenti]